MRRFEVHATTSKHVPFDGMPDLRGVASWQNMLRRLVFIVGLGSVQISKSQLRHFRKPSDTTCIIFEY